MTTKEKVKFLVFRSLGNFLLLMALFGVIATFGPVISQEIRYRVEKIKGVKYTVKVETEVTKTEQPTVQKNPPDVLSSIFSDSQDRIMIPSDTNFSIVIPKIGASSKIIANVDPANETEFKAALTQGIAHAKGTVFPGMPGNTYLFAHSTDNWWDVSRYNAVFFLLKDVEIGDEVVVFFENIRHNYIVTEKYLADPQEVSFLTNSRGNEEKLILQTCWPPGTAWKRLFIVAIPKGKAL